MPLALAGRVLTAQVSRVRPELLTFSATTILNTAVRLYRVLQMRDFLLAIVFFVGTVLLVGGCLYYDNLFSAAGAAIGFGAVLCGFAAIAKDRIDFDMTLF